LGGSQFDSGGERAKSPTGLFIYLFINGLFTDQLSQNVLDQSSPNFQDYLWMEMNDETLVLQSLSSQMIGCGNKFGGNSVKIGLPTFIYWTGIPQQVRGSQSLMSERITWRIEA